jgi:enoyl-CoA hydratase/carnithine racemase
MLTAIDEADGERVLTVQIHEATIDAELVSALESVLNDVEHGDVENLVLQFSGGPDSAAGEFPSWQPSPVRSDMRYFARWDETLSRISRLRAKTFAAYDGRVGAAAVQAGLVMDLRLASARSRLSPGSLSAGRFPGMGAYLLPKFIGLGNARRIFLLGEDLTASRALRIGLVDVVDDTVESAVAATIKALRPVTPEAACFTRRILDECYSQERSAAAELAKAARYKVGMPSHDDQHSRGHPRVKE